MKNSKNQGGKVNDQERVCKYLASNIYLLRNRKDFTQAQLAKVANIPRTTLSNIESGEGNPSLTNLVKIAGALGVSVEELLSRPRLSVQKIAAKDVPMKTRNAGQVRVFELLPDKVKGLAIERLEFGPASILPGHPHLAGTKEYLTVLQGEIMVHLDGTGYWLEKGDVLAFPGDQPHSYRNALEKKPSAAISVVIPVPASV